MAPLSYSENSDDTEARRDRAIQEIIDYQDGILFGQADFLQKNKKLDSENHRGQDLYDPWMDEAITTTSDEGF